MTRTDRRVTTLTEEHATVERWDNFAEDGVRTCPRCAAPLPEETSLGLDTICPCCAHIIESGDAVL